MQCNFRPAWLFVSLFIIFYLLSLYYYHSTSYRDPTSYFFDPHRAYEWIYSAHRIEEADAYIATVKEDDRPVSSRVHPPVVCVGIATVARPGHQYVRSTVGSLLAGMSEEERSLIFLNILIGHTNPSIHPVFSESWLDILPDRILRYPTTGPEHDQIVAWEEGGWYRNKTIYDYTYLLKDCYDTGAEYVAMIEDDTLAVAGWFRRLVSALNSVLTKTHPQVSKRTWIYLRLFYADALLGWNSEEWSIYLFWSFAAWASLSAMMIATKRSFPKHLEFMTAGIMAAISCVCIPAAILLVFLAGRQTVFPVSSGIHEMNKYGCCTQGLVFPRSIIPPLLERADLQTDWLVDMMIERIADRAGYQRWAIVPPLLQHIGATSSKGYGFDDSARHLWNFRFEKYPIMTE
ncbi:uncharacterized protein Z518_08387 [Rhinocladiella mackenziei CBS 650.93]|uniref:Uncharacterized protein n=1 Tax=Rhinocladiella mackenziei CBS 650.93 TaxID=1442369 RepID=A0A0D2IGQ0_9EURO|nr:uncharacterized protein Z518_08387 [Rhinocladiella mackenziei CBS 650.93]KIX02446.1 hypothetical protein Z518_08387 [Rhinocladiella mackenziei CBS 650.93]